MRRGNSDHVELAVGQTIAHYKVLSVLGAGGMGKVYLAYDNHLGRKVALKVLPSDFTQDADRVSRFQQEARAASGLNHPNIVTTYEIGRISGEHFIAMEFIDGKTVRQLIETQSVGSNAAAPGTSVTLIEMLNVAIQVADALDAAHEVGIVHRDIKPENIMVRLRDAYAKVLDFGLAKLTESAANDVSPDSPTLAQIQTNAGSIIGTASYMSPEQARGAQVDGRTDLWSLGVVIYEMITGNLPFAGSTSQDVIAAILRDEPKPIRGDVPDRLRWIIEKALRKERNARYQTARELASDLRDLQKREDDIRRGIEYSRTSDLEKVPQLLESTTEKHGSLTDNVAARPTSGTAYLVSRLKAHSVTIIALTAIISLTMAFVWYKFNGQKSHAEQNLTKSGPLQTMNIRRLTSTGKITNAAISPDGKYVVQAIAEGEQESLWLKHVATSSNVQVIPPADVEYKALTFSPGGDYLYYNVSDKKNFVSLYEMPVLGGASRKLVVDIDSVITFSPDGKQFAFVRGLPAQNVVSLFVANSDGTAERKIASHPIATGPYLGEPAWSSDGKVIVWPGPNSDASGTSMSLFAVQIADGSEKKLGLQSWAWVGPLCWLSDGSGLVFNARERVASPAQIWRLSYPRGEVHRITNDLNDYLGVSLTANDSALVTVESDQVSNIWVAPNNESHRARQITRTQFDGVEGISWTPDGKIVYTMRSNANLDLSIINADGTGQKQLTADSGDNTRPCVSFDGRYVVFASDRSGTRHIWRTDIDGSHPIQLTNRDGEFNPGCSPTGPSLVYELWLGQTGLWEMSMDGGESKQLTARPSAAVSISPDGKWFSCGDFEPTGIRRAIYPIEGGEPRRLIDVSSPYVCWTPDGRALAYLDENHLSNVSSETIEGGVKRQLTDFNSDVIFRFAWSKDGKQLAVARGTLSHDVVLINNFITGN